jgi:hypothetical protein
MERSRRRVWILVVAIAAFFSWGSPAKASGVTTIGVAAGGGVLVGASVTVPITFSTPIQVCNDNLASGVVPTGVLTAGVCFQGS